MHMKSAAQFLADELERLISLPLNTKEDLEHWYSARYALELSLSNKYPNFQYWHEVDHFFDDPDIRLKDSGYRECQHQKMLKYVACLRNETPTK